MLISASAASQIGDWLYNAALLAYVYTATSSAAWVGAATIFRLLPYTLFGAFGGVIADRFNQRKVLLIGDSVRAALMFALAAAAAADAPIALVIALTALASAAGTAERPATMALLPRLVGESRLGPANALLHTAQNLGIVVGPAIGALILTFAPSAVAFVVNGLTFVVSALLISTLRHRSAMSNARAGGDSYTQLREGIRTVWVTPFVLPLFVIVATLELTYGAQTVQLVIYAEQALGLGAQGYGYLMAVAGLGGLLSVVVNARLTMSTSATAIIVTGAAFCATQLAYAGVDGVVLALLITVIGGVGFVACAVVVETTLQRVLPAEAMGRVMGIYDSMSVAAMVAGATLAPILIDLSSLRTSLLILGLAAVLIIVASRAGLRGLDAVSRHRADMLAERVAVLKRVPLMRGAPRAVLEQLAAASQICPLPPGVDIVVQGAPAHAFYAVIDGDMIVRRDGVEVDRIGPGGYFGERGLLDNAPRNATVTTSVQSTVLRLEGEVLLDALESAPAMRSELTNAHRYRRSASGGARDVDGASVLVVSAGYPRKRPIYARMAELGARLVIVDEPGHWSESLVAEGIAARWLAAPTVGDADQDAAAVLDALERAGIRPDGVLTFWENSTNVAARVAASLGLPTNPVEAVDAARSKLHTRELSAELGLPTPKARRVRSLDELFAAAPYVGFPAVIKPEFGASAMGCVRVDTPESLPDIYALVRDAVSPEADDIFRTGNDLLVEEYLDGVEFDVDLVMHEGKCVFSSVSQNTPTAEPSFQETGLHLPPDHDAKAVARLVDLAVETARAFGLRRGVLHIEGKCTSRGPRILEVNARMGGGRIHEHVRAVWGVDLVQEHLRSCLNLAPVVKASRKPRCAVVETFLYAPSTGRLASLPLTDAPRADCQSLNVDLNCEVGDQVVGPDAVFATCLAEVSVVSKDLRTARAVMADVLRAPPLVVPRKVRELSAV